MFFSPQTLPPNPPKITVFIHGTHRFAKIIPKAIKPLYKRFHYKPGMHPLLSCPEKYYYRRFLNKISENGHAEFPKEHCYLFG